MKTQWLLLLVCMLAPVIGEVNDEEAVTTLLGLLIDIQYTLVKNFKQYQDEIRRSIEGVYDKLDTFELMIVKQLGQYERENFWALLLSITEQVNAKLSKMEQRISELDENILFSTLQPTVPQDTREPTAPRDCADVYDQGSHQSGIYIIEPRGMKPFHVYCDMTTDGGGWTVFQRRGDYPDATVDNFNRGWDEYKNGFGNLKTEYWLGLSTISRMTKLDNGYQELRVDLSDWDRNKSYAKYQKFRVEDESQGFRLRVGTYSGTAGDALDFSLTQMFSTSDQNNDTPTRNCALEMSGGWWFNRCGNSCLNCLNLKSKKTDTYNGIFWHQWKGVYYSLYQAEMKFRPMGWTSKRK